MNFIAAFQLATEPQQPAAQGVIFYRSVLSLLFTLRPQDPGVGYAF